MKAILKFLLLTTLTVIFLFSVEEHHMPLDFLGTNYSYVIEPESKLFLEGTSNVVDFTCECTNPSGSGHLSIQMAAPAYRFQNGSLQLPVKELDCGNRPMNKDMYEALKAEQYPHISIQPLSVRAIDQAAFSNCDEWANISVELQLTIAGVSRKVPMEVRGAHLGYELYRFKGSQAIYLTDYGIDPPRALLGAIRVDNCVTINVDLFLRLTAV